MNVGGLIERVATLAAAALIVASLLPLGARHWWVLELAAHFRVQYVAAAVALIMVLGARRRLAWCGALLACALLSAAPVLPYVPFGTPPQPPSGTAQPRVKVMVANLLFRNDSAQRLHEIVRNESPDVLLFVEFTPAWAEQVAKLRDAYPYRLEKPERGAFGMAIFSRYALDPVAPLPFGATLAIEAKVRSPAGPFTLIGVHLRSPTSRAWAMQRNEQLKLLAMHRAKIDGPLVVAGDFNVTPYSPILGDWLERTGLTEARFNRTLRPSWPTALPILAIPIDHLAVSKEVGIVAYRRLPDFGSDHYPVLAELAIAPPP